MRSSLVNIVSSRTAREVTQINPISEGEKTKHFTECGGPTSHPSTEEAEEGGSL